MARLAGVDLPRNKRMEIALTYIYGIGPSRSKELLEKTGISPDLRTDNLDDDQLSALRDAIEASWKVEGDLRRQVQADIRRKIEIGCYQGLRHRRGLPVRGQRTKTNARTRRVLRRRSQEKEVINGSEDSVHVAPFRPSCIKKNVAQGHATLVKLQQHHRVHHGPIRCCYLWSSSGQVVSRDRVSPPIRSADGSRVCSTQGDGARHEEG